MAEQPTGTVTFLFTDIEGSTQLWEEHAAAMSLTLSRHDALLRGMIKQHHGYIFKTIGDAFCAAFTSPADAIRAAVAAQQALDQELPSLRVRMAVHTGEAELRDGDYFGPALNRVARFLAAGHGGQVLLSRAAAEAVGDELPAESELRPLGTHRLRDIVAVEAIYQLVVPGLQAWFPPLDTLDIAFRRGVMRAGAIAGVVLAVVSGLAVTAVRQSRRAEQAGARAETQARISRRERYAAQMSLAGQALEAGNLSHARELVDRQRPGPGEEDLRGFAWRYLRRACRSDERFILTGNKEKVNSVAISPNGHLLASGADDKTVRLWDLASRRSVAVLPQSGTITAVAFSPDGQILAIGTRGIGSGAVKLWNVATRREIAPLKESTPGALAFSPDGKILAAGSGRVVHLWALATRRVIATLPGDSPRAQATAVAFSPDGRLLAYAFWLNPTTVKLWDMATKRVVATLIGHVGFVFSVAFSPDGKTLATGSGDNSVRLWDVGTRRTVGVPMRLAGVVEAVAFSPDGKLLATGSGDGALKLWEVASRQPVSLLKGLHGSVNSVAFTPDGKLLASGSDDHTVNLWNTAPPRDPNVLRGHRQWIWSVAFSPDSKTLASAGSQDRTVKLWDVATGRAIISREIVSGPGATGSVGDAVFSPDGRYLAFCGEPPAIQLWDAALKHEIGLFQGHTKHVNRVAFSPDGKLLASASEDETVRLWDVASRREVAPPLPAPGDIHTVLEFSPDGKSLARIGGGSAVLWDLASRRGTALFRGDPVGYALAFRPDGRILVAGGSDGRLRWWDVATHHLTVGLPGHAGRVMGAVYSPDGKEVATVGDDNTVRLWDPVTRQDILALKGHDAPLRGVAFSPDGNTLATSGADLTVRLWRAVPFAETAVRGSAPSRPASP